MRALALSALFLTACSPPAAGPPTWHADIQPLIQEKCGTCHKAGGIGPFELDSLAMVRAEEGRVRPAVTSRRMPPWPASNSCAEYAPNGSMTAAQIALLELWYDSAAPEGDPKSAVPQTLLATGLSRVDRTITMPEPFYAQKSPDEYRCFVLDWPETAPKFITGFNVVPGQPQLVHHANLFFINPDSVATYQAKDDAAPGAGYECYNFPSPIGEGGWIGTFVPGSLGADFPAGAGLKILPGSKLFIQVHYNITNGGPKPDQTSIEVKLEDKVRKEGSVQAWADPKWMSERFSMRIPKGEADVGHRFSMDPTPYLSLANRTFLDGKPIKLYMATAHMHAWGKSAKMEIERADGTKDCLLDIPKWQFHWQLPYSLKDYKVLNPGDKLAVECHWDNSEANQPYIDGVKQASKDINWGARTEDEMCVGGFFISQ
jgi:hypothetical protein